jgi:hypothetical protein
VSERDRGNPHRPGSKLKEAYALIVVVADMTGNTISWALYGVLGNKIIYNRPRAELMEVYSSLEAPLEFTVLEKLSYFSEWKLMRVIRVNK